MDKLGERIIKDMERIRNLRRAAEVYEREAADMRHDADEIERLLELARLER